LPYVYILKLPLIEILEVFAFVGGDCIGIEAHVDGYGQNYDYFGY
jgi:hypothetical protein